MLQRSNVCRVWMDSADERDTWYGANLQLQADDGQA